MGHKTNLKHKRTKSLPLPEAIDKLIQRSVDALNTGKIKVSASDLVRLIHMQKKLFPVAVVWEPPVWIDSDGGGR